MCDCSYCSSHIGCSCIYCLIKIHQLIHFWIYPPGRRSCWKECRTVYARSPKKFGCSTKKKARPLQSSTQIELSIDCIESKPELSPDKPHRERFPSNAFCRLWDRFRLPKSRILSSWDQRHICIIEQKPKRYWNPNLNNLILTFRNNSVDESRERENGGKNC